MAKRTAMTPGYFIAVDMEILCDQFSLAMVLSCSIRRKRTGR